MVRQCVFLFLLFITQLVHSGLGPCSGKFPNPITDVCWGCIFPIYIGTSVFTANQRMNRDPFPPWVCTCPAPPPIFQRVGVGIGLWEPFKILEAVRTPGCFPTLAGMSTTMPWAPAGSNKKTGDYEVNDRAFYNIHMYDYPVLSWFFPGLIDKICFQTSKTGFDLLYITEVDPLWYEDELASILSPEVFLYANPISQAACIADSTAASTTWFGLDLLHWCSGSQGSMFPISGSHDGHIGGVDSSLAKIHAFLYKLHREMILMETALPSAMCQPHPLPVMRKTLYKHQMMSPVPQPIFGFGFGTASQWFATGSEFPVVGEDFSHLIWRKRVCCAF